MTAHAPRPFFVAPDPGDHASHLSRRLLLVTVVYPPSAEVGSLRWQKMALDAFARGIGIDVIMVDPLEAELREESRLNEVPAGARLYDVPVRDILAQKIQRLLLGAIRSLLNPRRTDNDASRGQPSADRPPSSDSLKARFGRSYRAWMHYAYWEDWAARATAIGARLASDTPYHAIVSTGPPHIAHEAARRIAEASGRPLVIDLRDPWFTGMVEPPAMRSALWRRKTLSAERRCVERASLVVVNTDSCRTAMVARYTARSDRFLTVMNGADPDVTTGVNEETRFVISHAGSLYGGRDPRSLFRGVALAVRRLTLTPSDLRVVFMGSTSFRDVPLSTLAEEAGIGAYFACDSRRPRAEALALIRDSAMVTVLPQEFVHSIPGKLFEYMQLAAWPLVLTERGTATDVLLQGAGADVVLPDDIEGIARAVEQRYLDFRAGIRPTPINADGRFNRDRQATKLLDAIDRIR